MSDVVRSQDWVAPENIVLEDVRKCPRRATVTGKSPASLAKVRVHAVELPPSDRHLVMVGGIDCDRGFVCRIAGNILAVVIDVDLITDESPLPGSLRLGDAGSPDEHGRVFI